jgi:hypothetical protein
MLYSKLLPLSKNSTLYTHLPFITLVFFSVKSYIDLGQLFIVSCIYIYCGTIIFLRF